jgi:hypothetical protein
MCLTLGVYCNVWFCKNINCLIHNYNIKYLQISILENNRYLSLQGVSTQRFSFLILHLCFNILMYTVILT